MLRTSIQIQPGFRHLVAIVVIGLLLLLQSGCAQLRLPAIDPSGNRIFLPGQTTTVLGSNPGGFSNQGGFVNRGLTPNPGMGIPATGVPRIGNPIIGGNPFRNPLAGQPVVNPLRTRTQPYDPSPPALIGFNRNRAPRYPSPPAFTQPPTPEYCATSGQPNIGQRKHIIPNPNLPKSPGQKGQIIMTPHRIIAPVGSEVVVLAGICGGDGYYVTNQPLEWMLSNDSVGQLIQIGGMEHSAFNRLISPKAKKFDGQYAWGRTSMKQQELSRGTPTPADDVSLLKGQTFVSVSSASPGTSYITGVAPKAEGWDKRRSQTIIHWVDGRWAIPVPSTATSGTVHPLTTVVSSTAGQGGIEGWKVRYAIVGGAPAEFAPTGSKTAEATTDANGQATVQIRQPEGNYEPGETQVRVDVVRPKGFGEPELVVESGITTVNWSAPALTIRAIGPRTAGLNQPFNYRIEVSNPGDVVSRGVVVRTNDLDGQVQYISSTPKPTEYGNQYEWQLGDVPPGGQPRVIDIQLKSEQRGNVGLCFEVASQSDGLQTEACAQTEILACIGLKIDGPRDVTVGSEADFTLQIVNECDETLENVELTVDYDIGLLVPGRGNPIRYTIESLPPGQTENVPLSFQILQPGKQCFNLSIAAQDGHVARAKRCLTATGDAGAGDQQTDPGSVLNGGTGPGSATDGAAGGQQPIDVRMDGRRLTQVGGQAMVRTMVVNNTNQPIENVTLTTRSSTSLEPFKITDGYPHGWLGQDYAFNLGTLAPGQEALVEIIYNAVTTDPSAFSEMTASTPSGIASDTERVDIQIQPGGSGVLAPDYPGDLGGPGEGFPADDVVPGNQPDSQQPGEIVPFPNEGPIGIPRDDDPRRPTEQGLTVDVRTLDRNINVNGRSRVEFSVTNNSSTSDQNVDIRMLIPQTIQLRDLDNSQGQLSIVDNNADFTQFQLNRRIEMRPGESLRFVADLVGVQPGEATFEVQAQSVNSTGTITGSDTILIQ